MHAWMEPLQWDTTTTTILASCSGSTVHLDCQYWLAWIQLSCVTHSAIHWQQGNKDPLDNIRRPCCYCYWLAIPHQKSIEGNNTKTTRGTKSRATSSLWQPQRSLWFLVLLTYFPQQLELVFDLSKQNIFPLYFTRMRWQKKCIDFEWENLHVLMMFSLLSIENNSSPSPSLLEESYAQWAHPCLTEVCGRAKTFN